MPKIISYLFLVLIVSPFISVAQDSGFPNAPISPTSDNCREFSQKVNSKNNEINKRYSQCHSGAYGDWDDNIRTISPLTCKPSGIKGGFTKRKDCESLLLARCDAKPIFESKRLEVHKCYANAQNAKQTSNSQSTTNNDYATVTGNDVLLQQGKKISRTHLAKNSSIYKNYKNLSKRMKAIDDIMNFYSTNSISSLTNIASRIGSFAHSKSTAGIYLQSMRKLGEINQRTMDSLANSIKSMETINLNDINSYRKTAQNAQNKYIAHINTPPDYGTQQLSKPYVHTKVALTQNQLVDKERIKQLEKENALNAQKIAKLKAQKKAKRQELDERLRQLELRIKRNELAEKRLQSELAEKRRQNELAEKRRQLQYESDQYEDDYTPPTKRSQSEQFLELYDAVNNAIRDAKQQNNNSNNSQGGYGSQGDYCTPSGEKISGGNCVR